VVEYSILRNEYLMKDWRGNFFSVGTRVVYPTSARKMVEGTVTDIYQVSLGVNKDLEWKWIRIEPGMAEFIDPVHVAWRIIVQLSDAGNKVSVTRAESITVIDART
jgi:hypothetical protein